MKYTYLLASVRIVELVNLIGEVTVYQTVIPYIITVHTFSGVGVIIKLTLQLISIKYKRLIYV